MTIGEIIRYIESRIRIQKLESQEKAVYDYIQAVLIIKGISICLGSKEDFPTKEEAYPEIFETKKEKEEREVKEAVDVSAIRFMQFAHSYNNRFKNKEVPTDNL